MGAHTLLAANLANEEGEYFKETSFFHVSGINHSQKLEQEYL